MIYLIYHTIYGKFNVGNYLIYKFESKMYDHLSSELHQNMIDLNVDLHSFYSNKEDYIDEISKQKNDYNILICTDALSEGVNLNRAGVVINYDIPYNPTRVIQRVGRINRINKRVFETIDILNFFPTLLGDSEVKIKQITTLKMGLINNVIGSDTKTLTPDEDLQTFFIDEFNIWFKLW